VRRPVLLVLALALVAVGCSDSGPAAAPPTTEAETTTTTLPPTTSTTARPTTTSSTVPRTTTTTTVTLGPGDASLVGTVSGPAGPVDGAVVRIERLVGRAVATADVTTSGGGAWQLTSILGGSYRVRAFKTPDLAPSQVETFFLAANERRNLDFKLAAAGGERITAVVSPDPPRVDQPATVTITIGIGSVDAQGRSVLTPRPGLTLVLAERQAVSLLSPQNAVTDAGGAATWQFRCTMEGPAGFVLTIGTGATPVSIPNCAPPGATPTTRRN
jgi:hypothetical protein